MSGLVNYSSEEEQDDYQYTKAVNTLKIVIYSSQMKKCKNGWGTSF